MGHRRIVFTLLAVLVTLLGACGGSDKKDDGLPTLISENDLATRSASAEAVVPTTPAPSLTPSQTAVPTMTDTLPPAPTMGPTFTLEPSATPAPSATIAEVQVEATGIPLTNTAAAATGTAAAQLLPITQTMGAIAAATQNAQLEAAQQATATATPGAPESGEPYQIIFYSNRYGSDDIFLLRLDGSQRLLIGSSANEREPSCAPDGSGLVFASDASGSYQIYSQPINGTSPIPLTNSEGINFAPIYSPDGSQIAFVSTRNQGIPTIWLMNPDGSNQRQLTTELGRDTSPSWGPDGRQLLFSSEQTGDWDIFLTVIDEVEGEFPMLPPEISAGNQMWPIFDPYGERIAYTLWSDLNDPATSDIYVIDFELDEPIPVHVEEGADIAWAWGDDNHLLASVGGPDDIQIAVIDVSTGQTFQLTQDGSFNGGARLCTVYPSTLPAEPQPIPSATPTEVIPTETPLPAATPMPSPTPTIGFTLTSNEHPLSPELTAAMGHAHIVESGESLAGISAAYGVPLAEIAGINKITNINQITVGQRIVIPITRTAGKLGGYQLPDDANGESQTVLAKAIVVDLSEQRAYALENGRVVHDVLVSTGLPDTPTVLGQYHIYVKHPTQTMAGEGYYLPAVPYVMYFYHGYGLHGAYWHNNFGHPMSHGCVNLSLAEAKWFYNWAEVGTSVFVKP